MKGHVKDPLRMRVFRELRDDWKKYIVIFIFLVLMIGFVSGMYVANNSMLMATDNVKTENIREDGHFELEDKADKELIKDIESGDKVDAHAYYVYDAYKDVEEEDIWRAFESDDYKENLKELYDEVDRKAEKDYENAVGAFDLDDPYFRPVPVKLYENFYKNADEDIDGDGTRDSGIRVFKNRDDINLYCLMEGRGAETDDEIVIDRMHADNRDIKVGDNIKVNGKSFEVVGLVALPNYSTLHEKNTDTMFDALTFDVAMTTEGGFDSIDTETHYEYAWLYEDKPESVKDEKKKSDNFLKALITQAAFADNEIEAFVPEYANQAIQFAPDDFGSDKAMGGVLLNVLIVVLAFIFGITISNTISREATVIGTLRASGYTVRELTVHYMTMPLLVTLLGALVGNILGYSYFKNVVVSMYYNSYSLPTYETIWTPDAFVRTTIIPIILMLIINFVIIRRKLRLSPLKFLRNDLKTSRRRRAVKLPEIGFFGRFRLRIFLQNLSGYFMLLVGITFVMVMLAMAVGMPDTLTWYQENAADMMIADYEVVLEKYKDEDGNIITTDAAGAERFSSIDLVDNVSDAEESVNGYGLVPGSKYIKMKDNLADDEVCVSSAYSKKFGLNIGDTVKFKERYGYGTYEYKIADIADYDGTIAVFMDIDRFNEVFKFDEGSFSGYFSEEEPADIDEDYVVTVFTKDEVLKLVSQMDHSMGSYMLYFQYLCILLSAVLIFLLTKVIIERNQLSISMTKILGYTSGEISRLYLVTTTVVVIVSEIIAIVVGVKLMEVLWASIMERIPGYVPYYISNEGIARMFVLVFIGYLLVMLMDYRRIRRIPMDEALKDLE